MLSSRIVACDLAADCPRAGKLVEPALQHGGVRFDADGLSRDLERIVECHELGRNIRYLPNFDSLGQALHHIDDALDQAVSQGLATVVHAVTSSRVERAGKRVDAAQTGEAHTTRTRFQQAPGLIDRIEFPAGFVVRDAA